MFLRFYVEVFTLFSLTLSSQKPSPSVSHIQCWKEKEDLLCEIAKRKDSEEQLQQENIQLKKEIEQIKRNNHNIMKSVNVKVCEYI